MPGDWSKVRGRDGMDATSSGSSCSAAPFFCVTSFLTGRTHMVLVGAACELMLSETYIASTVITFVWIPKDSSVEAS